MLIWSRVGMQGEGSERLLRKPADQRHRPTRFSHAKIRERPNRESSPVRLVSSLSPASRRRAGQKEEREREVEKKRSVRKEAESVRIRERGGNYKETSCLRCLVDRGLRAAERPAERVSREAACRIILILFPDSLPWQRSPGRPPPRPALVSWGQEPRNSRPPLAAVVLVYDVHGPLSNEKKKVTPSIDGSRGGVVPIKANRVRSPGWVKPGFTHVRIVPDDAAGLRVFSVISGFPPPFHSVAASCSPRFTSSALKTSMLKSRANLFAHSPTSIDRTKTTATQRTRTTIKST
ncbi:hypothetical protein PR048_019555 [Dryococelus australis]|uniref:Uncharacterized protein n=1 Tax=Dryococelus australis TaxID=614101 RepID=A0ABQ9H3T0_9NEOP|nr:hypothetical protein PR048_019555 [Dryococelus australis]